MPTDDLWGNGMARDGSMQSVDRRLDNDKVEEDGVIVSSGRKTLIYMQYDIFLSEIYLLFHKYEV